MGCRQLRMHVGCTQVNANPMACILLTQNVQEAQLELRLMEPSACTSSLRRLAQLVDVMHMQASRGE